VRTDFVVDLRDIPNRITTLKKLKKQIRKFIPQVKNRPPTKKWKIKKPEIKFGGKGLNFKVPEWI
jgi:hypothetical protein